MPARPTKVPERLVLYGSLRRGLPAFRRLGLQHALEFVGPCVVRGTLYDLGDYPGFVPAGRYAVHGDLFAVADEAVLRRLDDFEGFRREDRVHSLYLRQPITLCRPAGEGWIYVYNRSPGADPVVTSGDWLAHVKERGSALR